MRKYSARFEQELRRFNYVTPKNYLDFIRTYCTDMHRLRRENEEMTHRLEGGLLKLTNTSAEVDRMRTMLAQQKLIVDAKTKEVTLLLENISKASAEANEKQTAATTQQANLDVELVAINEQKDEAELALGSAMPALLAAADALNTLEKKDITEIRSFITPPVAVQQVCECVVILLKLPDKSWKTAKLMLTDSNFLSNLVNYDKDGITGNQAKAIAQYLKNPEFSSEALKAVSKAGAGLLKWVEAMMNYYEVAKKISPLRQSVAKAEKELAKSERDLDHVKKELANLKATLQDLSRQLQAATADKNELTAKAARMQKQLQAAERLIKGLGSERSRWSSDVEGLQVKRRNLVGDCLLTSAFLSYLGAFTYNYRQEMMDKTWTPEMVAAHIPITMPFRVEDLLTTSVEVMQWASEGLPQDELSVQNGILTVSASRFPLCIDPQMQALAWVKQREGKRLDGRMRSFNDADFLKQLEMAITYGFPFLFENLDEYIDPVINPILEKSVSASGARQFIVLGDKEVEWSDDFRLYLVTKLSNPHYTPEIFGKTMIINYTVTQEGLRHQLLNFVVGFERPDLEQQRLGLIKEMSANQTLLKKYEDSLLRELAEATGNILENEQLLQVSPLPRTVLSPPDERNLLDRPQHTRPHLYPQCRLCTKPGGHGKCDAMQCNASAYVFVYCRWTARHVHCVCADA